MCLIGPHRGRHDDGHRGSDAELHARVLGHAEKAEDLEQHWDDDGAAAVAATGVDLISCGWITHSAPILDLGLDIAG